MSKHTTYRRLYYYRNEEYGFATLLNRRLKVSRIMDLNDPFELLAPNLQDPAKGRALRTFKTEQDERTGILCFSENRDSPVMWAHYGDRYRGFCLGFDVLKMPPTTETRLAQVKYVEQRLSWPRERGPEFLERIFVTKFSHWSYEREWRLLIALDDCEKSDDQYFRPFSVDLLLREVYIGARSSISPWKVKAAVEGLNVRVFTTRPSLQKFRVVRNNGSW